VSLYLLEKLTPFLAAPAVWTVMFDVVRVSQGRQLQRAIEELDQIENESGVV
jgi:hypothetical protein